MAGKYESIPTTIESSNSHSETTTTPSQNSKHKYTYAALVSTFALIITLYIFSSSSHPPTQLTQTPPTQLTSIYHPPKSSITTTTSTQPSNLDKHNRFILQNYDQSPPHSNFLPSVAGIYGKPCWTFYNNRGQGVTSFGTLSKDFPVLEFQSADKAYFLTRFVGFRSFFNVSYVDDVKEDGKSNRRLKKTSSSTSSSSVKDDSDSCPAIKAPETIYEPFTPTASTSTSRTMYVGQNDLEITEFSPPPQTSKGLETSVLYFTLPNERFSALVRRVILTNNNPDKRTLTVQGLDGLTKIEPIGGLLDGMLKNMGRTLEGWMNVYDARAGHGGGPAIKGTTLPFYKLSSVPSDGASVVIESEGNFVVSVFEGVSSNSKSDSKNSNKKTNPLLNIVYDTSRVFGVDTTLTSPTLLQNITNIDLEIAQSAQSGAAKTSSAYAALPLTTLKFGESVTFTSYYGKTSHIANVPDIADVVSQAGYSSMKIEEARGVTDGITKAVKTGTGDRMFNLHVEQMFLDNCLRGGVPLVLGDDDGDEIEDGDDEADDDSTDSSKKYSNESKSKSMKQDSDESEKIKIYHAFSRIHGDPERDYNAFSIDPTYFSQGPGNFRDVAQNRRNDVFFEPRIGASGVRQFLSFIQADGYEPLTVQSVAYHLPADECADLAEWAVGKGEGVRQQREALQEILEGGIFRPGQLFQLMEDQDILLKLGVTNERFISKVLSKAIAEPMAVYGDGFWADHWTYYLDLITSYLSVYPDREQSLMYDSEPLPYFYSPASCVKRSEKYVLTPTYGGVGRHVQQLGAMVRNEDKVGRQNAYIKSKRPWTSPDANWQHAANDGTLFKSPPVAKLLLLGVIKFATRDPYGMGLEYEGGKPGWNDAMNGLVGMLGSGMPETYELQLLLEYVLKVVSTFERDVEVPEEIERLMMDVGVALTVLEESEFDDRDVNGDELAREVPMALFEYWNTVASAREEYRNSTMYTFSGETVKIPCTLIKNTLQRYIKHIQTGVKRAMKMSSSGSGDTGLSGVSPSYFSYNCTRYELTGEFNGDGHPLVNALAFNISTFPLFLEGPVRYMKTLSYTDVKSQNKVYDNVKASGLYDEKLNMYTVSASLKGQSYDMGRMMAFSPGWLENQSVWTHMSYKYYLQLLRGNLYETFYSELTGGGMLPYMDLDVYGRSLLECSSFLASSAFPDPSSHGRGYLARLSGSTAEFLSIWTLMFIGPTPFVYDRIQEQVTLKLKPALAKWMFVSDVSDKHGSTLSYTLLGSIKVVYHNLRNIDLYGVSPSRMVVEFLWHDGKDEIDGGILPEVIAIQVRKGGVKKIECYFD